MIHISSIDSEELKIFRETSEVRLLRFNEPGPGLFIAESGRVLARALEAGYEPLSILVDAGQVDGAGMLKSEGQENCSLLVRVEEDYPEAQIFLAPPQALKDIRGYEMTGGLLAVMKRKILPGLEEIISGRRRIAVFEDVENPTNVGALFRDAAALGIEAIVLTTGSSDPLYRRAARVSMGTVFQIPWTFAPIDEYMDMIKTLGYKTAAMALKDDSIPISDERLRAEEHLAILMGNEASGLRAETLFKTDYSVIIPMAHGVDSLNVAAAGAVAFWELTK